MKRKTVIIATAMLSLSLYSQAQYIGVGCSNNGALFYAGVVAGGVELNATYRIPFLSAVKASILSLSIGKEILLTNEDKDNWTITPSIGGGNLKYKDFSEYNTPPEYKIKEVNEYRVMYNLELGKDMYMGRFLMAANYCKDFSFSIGLKCFLTR